MTTTITAITDTYLKVADAGAWTAIQITGPTQVDLVLADTEPADTVNGFIFRTLDTILPSTYGDANVYIKTRVSGNVSNVAISAE